MEISFKLKIKPFQTPNFAILDTGCGLKQDGLRELPSIPLRELDSLILHSLCEQFRNEVFRKAGKEQPPMPERRSNTSYPFDPKA